MSGRSTARGDPLVRLPVGARKVGRLGEDPVIYLGKDYRWLIGKKVYVEIIIRS